MQSNTHPKSTKTHTQSKKSLRKHKMLVKTLGIFLHLQFCCNLQLSFFFQQKKNYRVSGVSINMEDIFSGAEEELEALSVSRTNSIIQSPDRASPDFPAPPVPLPAADGAKKMVELGDPDEIYAPLQEEVLALGLEYNENEHDDEDNPQTSTVGTNTVINTPSGIPVPPALLSLPPPPPPVPPPPPPPLPPPPMFQNTPVTSPVRRMSVKRINWEKIEPLDLGNTVWGQLGEDHTINDVVKYLDLEEHFAMKKTTKVLSKNQVFLVGIFQIVPVDSIIWWKEGIYLI